MQFETSPDKQLLAKVDGREILPSIYAIEHAKVVLEKQSTESSELAGLTSSLAQLASSQIILDAEVTELSHPLTEKNTSVLLDASQLHLGLQSIIDGIRPGRERRLVKRMIKTLCRHLEQ